MAPKTKININRKTRTFQQAKGATRRFSWQRGYLGLKTIVIVIYWITANGQKGSLAYPWQLESLKMDNWQKT